MDPSEITALGLEYLNRTRRHREGAPYFTDKMPNNFAHIGLILATMPNAKIIDARRYPSRQLRRMLQATLCPRTDLYI